MLILGVFGFGRADLYPNFTGILESGSGHMWILLVVLYLFFSTLSALAGLYSYDRSIISLLGCVLGYIRGYLMHIFGSFGLLFGIWALADASLISCG